MRAVFLLTMIGFMAVFTLGGCGIKPSQIDPPQGGNVDYPATYPKLDQES